MNIEEDIIEFRKLIENGEYIDSSDIIQFINNVEIIVNVLKKYALKNNWTMTPQFPHVSDWYCANEGRHGYEGAREALGLEKYNKEEELNNE